MALIKNFSDSSVCLIKDKKSIFLAGPTLRNESFEKSWRKTACDILEKLNFNGICYIPEFETGNNPMEFDEQVEWERTALVNADIICFYIPRKLPELPGFTTNVEFGMYLARKPESIMLCCPIDSCKNRYLEWLYLKEKPNDKIYRELETMLTDAVNKGKIL